jgi:hypothetical protein
MIVAAALASPVTARERHSASRSMADNAYASAPGAASVNKHGCDRAPRVGAYATQPWRKPPCEPAQGY